MEPAFPFLALPRELRDQIYEATLWTAEGDEVTRIGSLAESSPDIWYPKRDALPGFYRPLKHYHKASRAYEQGILPNEDTSMCSLHWTHETRVVRVPALFHVGGMMAREAREMYMSKSIMLEAKITDDFGIRMDEWMHTVGKQNLDLVQRLHIYVHVSLRFQGDSKHPMLVKLKNTNDFERDLIDPIFRIEIRRRGQMPELVILCVTELPDKISKAIVTAVQEWAARDRNRRMDFAGTDVVAAARALITAITDCDQNHMCLAGDLEVSKVAHVYDFPDNDKNRRLGYGTAVRLKAEYPHILTKVTLDSASYGRRDSAKTVALVEDLIKLTV